MKFILAKKVEMSQVYDEKGAVRPVTWLLAGPMVVAQEKTKEKDGYTAVQFGFGTKKEKRAKKPQLGHAKELGIFAGFREMKGDDINLKRGDKVDVTSFVEGDIVAVSGTVKGRGFQGVVKRHRFAGGPRTHGQKHSEREPGTISGGSRGGGRVPKGLRMAGRMGGNRVTVKNLKVLKIIPEKNLLAVSGAIPGHRGSLVEIRG